MLLSRGRYGPASSVSRPCRGRGHAPGRLAVAGAAHSRPQQSQCKPCAFRKCTVAPGAGGCAPHNAVPHRRGRSQPLLAPLAAAASALFPRDDDDNGDDDISEPWRLVGEQCRCVKPASNGGRRPHRGNPLSDYSGLLSSYKANKLKELLHKTEVDLGELQADMGVKLRHPEAVGMALLSPDLSVVEKNGCPLPAEHLALLGEALVQLAAKELTWSVMEQAAAAAEAQLAEDSSDGTSWAAAPATRDSMDKTLLNQVAAAAGSDLPQLLVERWKVDRHARYPGARGPQGPGPSAKDLTVVAKALVAVLYLDGGYAEAVRPALAPLLAEVLLRPRAGSDSEDSKAAVSGPRTKSPLDVVGRRLEQALVSRPPGQRLQPLRLELPRGKDNMHRHRSSSKSSSSSSGGPGVSPGVRELALFLLETLGPLLMALKVCGDGYVPENGERFVELGALVYAYLHNMPPPPARGAPASRPWEALPRLGQRPGAAATTGTAHAEADSDVLHPPLPHAIATSPAAPAALIALGKEVHRVAITELLLEREAEILARDRAAYSKEALCLIKKFRRRLVQEVRDKLVELSRSEVRGQQMRALVPTLARDNGDHGMQARVPEAVYGVLGIVMLEGGLKHARTVARGVVKLFEVPEAWAALEHVHAAANKRK